jgi:hypothetical protein
MFCVGFSYYEHFSVRVEPIKFNYSSELIRYVNDDHPYNYQKMALSQQLMQPDLRVLAQVIIILAE